MSTCKQQSKENRRLREKLSPLRSVAIAGPVSKPVKEKTTELHSFKLRRIRLERAQSWDVSEAAVENAFLRVKANKSGPGVDGQTIEMFESKLGSNVYKLSNRMSSGSYFPQPVKRVEIPKPDGRTRPLGIPTVTDRVAQQVVKNRMEPSLELIFHKDSYGYRPERSTLDALRNARMNCWRREWVLDLDIKGFFDNIDHDIMMALISRHTDKKWILRYVERWLKAPIAMPDGSMVISKKGTPQGGVISPLLANLYLHYAFDSWMEKENPTIPFERYADDVVAHCTTRQQAAGLHNRLKERMEEYKLTLHPEKTKVVYCKDTGRSEDYPLNEFNFLGHTFKAWKSKQGRGILTFEPGISLKAQKRIIEKVTTELRWSEETKLSVTQLSKKINPALRGWIDFYGVLNEPAILPLLNFFNQQLVTWATNTYPRFKGNSSEAEKWLASIARKQPSLFYHWRLLHRPQENSSSRRRHPPKSKSSSTPSSNLFSSSTSSSNTKYNASLPPTAYPKRTCASSAQAA